MAFNSVQLSPLSLIWVRGFVAEVGGGEVSACVCAQALQNKPINIPGSLGSCSSELNLTAGSMHTRGNTHIQTPSSGLLCFFAYLISSVIDLISLFHSCFSITSVISDRN